ncbi:hypothetical protein ABKN59_007400 [Abortiporus biennis]
MAIIFQLQTWVSLIILLPKERSSLRLRTSTLRTNSDWVSTFNYGEAGMRGGLVRIIHPVLSLSVFSSHFTSSGIRPAQIKCHMSNVANEVEFTLLVEVLLILCNWKKIYGLPHTHDPHTSILVKFDSNSLHLPFPVSTFNNQARCYD